MLKGHCLCGAVRFEATGKPLWVVHCHCESCRRATSAPMATYVGFRAAQVSWTGQAPKIFASSGGVERGFCARCGSPMCYVGERWPGEIHLFAASFEDPAALVPRAHVNVAEQIPWLRLADGLRRYATTAEEGPPLA